MTVYEDIVDRLDDVIALLTISCQRSPEAQNMVQNRVENILLTNRDPHLLFNQVGIAIGFVSEIIVRGAFLSLWIRNNETFCDILVETVRRKLKE